MSNHGPHPKEALQELVDERIDDRTHAELQSHLNACEECRNELASLRRLKGSLARVEHEPLPDSMRVSVQAALDLEDAASGAGAPETIGWTRRRALGVVPVAIAAAVLLGFFYFLSPSPELPLQVAGDYRDFQSDALELQMLTTRTEELEDFFRVRGIRFETRVFDLGMMEFALTGGSEHCLNGKPSALFVYRGPGEVTLLCQMFEGKLSELPEPDETRENDGIRFQIYERNGLTMAFWQEGSVICVLVSDAGAEQVIQLAFAKAVKV